MPELVVATAPFEPLQQILTVYVLNYRSLHDACETLENAAAIATLSFVNIDDSLSLPHIIAFDARGLLRTRSLAWNVATHLPTVLRS